MVNVDNIPAELKSDALWCAWKYEARDGSKKPTKIPYNPKTDKRAKSNDPSTFVSFQEAHEKFIWGQYEGLGVGVFGTLCAVDIDHCISADGSYSDMAQDIITTMDSYTEVSPSGTGVRILFHASGLEYDKTQYYINNQKAGLEVYVAGMTQKYVTVTGNTNVPGKTIEERAEQLQIILDKYMQRKQKSSSVPPDSPVQAAPVFQLDDDALLSKANNGKNGAAFAALWRGDINGYPSHSEADQALCNHLAFWCRKDAEQMDRLFRQSGLMREKWDRAQSGSTYGTLTIQSAIDGCTTTYDPDSMRVCVTDDFGNPISVRPTDFTDTANSRVFARVYTGKVVYATTTGWLIWNGQKWEENDLAAADLAMRLTDYMMDEARQEVKAAGDALTAAEVEDDADAKSQAKDSLELAKAYMKHAKATRANTKIRAMLQLAQSHLHIKAELLDAEHHLLNTPAGIVDLGTGSISPHDPAKYCTKITAYAPTQDGADLWAALLKTVTCDDEKLEGFLQQTAGMSAIGMVYEENLVIAIGDGSNGKSTYFNALAAVLGDYSGTIAADVLTTSGKAKGAELASIKGKRLVIAAETEEGARLSLSMLKQLTSTDKIHAERKYRDPEDFKPSHTTVLYTNHMPRIGSTDTGTWRRILTIPFDAEISQNQVIKNYADKLIREAGGAILAWIIEGAVNFHKVGHRLVIPEVVQMKLEEYQQENDWMGQFLDEHCDIGAGRSVQAKALYDTYRQWGQQVHNYARRIDAFTAEMVKRNFEKRKSNTGAVWYGLSLRPTTDFYHVPYSQSG